MGSLRQDCANGTLVLEQNDGNRSIHWSAGEIIYLHSDAAGEQFGNYLLRQGILDLPSLNELLANEERFRIGEKVVQWGLMSLAERDFHLRTQQEQIMIHALEHPIIRVDWEPRAIGNLLSEDLHFRLDHRQFVWRTFQEAHNLGELCDLLYEESKWKWTAPLHLLDLLGDLPLTPQVAYVLSFWGPEPMGFQTFLSLSRMEEEHAARLLVTLWALGALSLQDGGAGALSMEVPPTLVVPEPVHTPLTAPLPEFTPREPSPAFMEQEGGSDGGILDFLPRDTPTSLPLDPFIPTMADMTIQLAEDEGRSLEPPTARARKHLLKAKALLVQDRVAEAIRLLEQSVKLDPESEPSYEAWLLLGKHRLSNPAWANRAIEALQAASRLRPKAAEPWALMGEIYHRKAFKANARACFKKALELDPSVPVPADINIRNEDPDERSGFGLLNRFKSFLSHPDKD